MLILTQLQPIAVIFTLPEDQLQIVAKRMTNSTLQVNAFSRDNQTKLASGKLQTIDNQIDQTTGTAKLKAVFDNKDNQLWPNQFVNANLLLETRKNSTMLPTAAILRGPQGDFVYVVKPDKTVAAQTVAISLTQGNITVVTAGVNPGDTVVTDGQDKLQTGSKVEPRASGGTGGGQNAGVSPASTDPASGKASGLSSPGSPASGSPAR
jgi:multidrug efflux system membrane fusion protein